MSSRENILPSPPRVPAVRRTGSTPFEPVCALFRRYLRGEKLKFTPERAMILDAALRQQGLFNAETLVSHLSAAGARASRATVYRTLTHLHDAGILKQVFFDNRQSYFEVLAGRESNDYLICIESGRVIEFRSDKLRKLRDAICAEHGFEPISHQFQIYGVKRVAAQSAAGSKGAGAEVSER